MTIKNFKTIIITANTAAGGRSNPGTTFSIPIFLQFIPTHFILKLFSYSLVSAGDTNNNILLLKTSLLNNEPILSMLRIGGVTFKDLGNIQLDTKFKMNPSVISGNYDFTLCDTSGNLADEFQSMQFALTIEFVEEI